MRININILFVLILLLFANNQTIFAQKEKTKNTLPYKNYFSFNTFQLMFKDYRVSYEFPISKRVLFKTSIGYKYGENDSLVEYTGFFGAFSIKEYPPIQIQDWYYLNLGCNYLFRNENPLFQNYFAIDLLLRYNYVGKRYLVHIAPEDHYEWCKIQSNEMYIAGCQFLIGNKFFNTNVTKNFNTFFDLYLGLGVRCFYRKSQTFGAGYEHTNVYGLEINENPSIHDNYYVLPTFHLGLRMGFAWRKPKTN